MFMNLSFLIMKNYQINSFLTVNHVKGLSYFTLAKNAFRCRLYIYIHFLIQIWQPTQILRKITRMPKTGV